MKRIVTLAVIAALMLAVFVPSGLAITNMYVYTSNGGSLNVRSSPVKGDNIIGSLPYGSTVGVSYHLGNGWSCIVWGSYGDAYVQTSFLVNYYPGPKPTAKPKPTASPSESGGTLGDINAEFRSAKSVTPYQVVTHNARTSGTVNMRWAPSTSAQRLTTYQNGVLLTVIAEMKNWYQVEDPNTGAVGFISKNLLSKAN